ncbi:hypothetical protein HBI56_084020 [Parastagonospora nodorum]|nr:hypothetical protein HBH56_102540 [Parastagonospora nodorum]KAH3929500.1 hypothetical protein HBH54_127870 [Parastagonospora nodorum]KAH3951512.1 hypothetical protein HBH53_061890 [Parastagonospora nodorum]KAH3975398.1 hypothetical protein HBH52_124970 [Parastagonospora nodorum]KAH3978952.1 hypothetical protein HBH51_061920 [Parastagonospora nodorum]
MLLRHPIPPCVTTGVLSLVNLLHDFPNWRPILLPIVCVTMSHPALPFFSLPKHVRLLVYEQLESSNKYVHLSNQPDQDPDCAILVA